MVIWLITESANMLIMLYAYARASGDGSLVSQHVSVAHHILGPHLTLQGQYNLTKRWADYLVNNTLVTHYQWVLSRSYSHWNRADSSQVVWGWTSLGEHDQLSNQGNNWGQGHGRD